MEAVIWAAVLVVTGLFFTLWLVAHGRLNKPTMIIIEPLGSLIKSWQIARYVGQGSQVESAVKILAATKAGDGKLADILPPLKGKPPKVALLKSRSLPLIGEQRFVEESGKKFSYIVGSVAEVKSQLILSSAEQKEAQKLSENAGTHGFLALFIGRTAVHGSAEKLESLQHIFLGAVILEANLRPQVVKEFAGLPASKKILTALPAELATFLADAIGVTGTFFTPSTQDSAEKFDRKVKNAAVIAGIDDDTRYRAIRALEHEYRCQSYQ